MELCRLASTVLVMLVHSTFQSVGWDCSSFGILLLAAFSIIGVDVFVLVTGFFSTEPKRISLANLLFICFFWMVFRLAVRFTFDQPFRWGDCFFVTKSNWFIPSYLCLLFITPVLNSFCNSSSKRSLLGVVSALLFFEMWCDLLPPHPSVSLGSQRGSSVLSFITLYLLSRYIHLYGVPQWFRKGSSWFYIFCSIFLSILALLCIKVGFPATQVIYASSNPLVIFSALSFLLMFKKVKIDENPVINHLAKSALPVLLSHSAIFFLYTKQFRYIFSHYSTGRMIIYWVLAIAIVFVASVAIDQVRLMLWKPVENSLRKRIKKNELF